MKRLGRAFSCLSAFAISKGSQTGKINCHLCEALRDAGYKDVGGGSRFAHPDGKSKHLATKYPDFNALRNSDGETQAQILGLKAPTDSQFPAARTTLQMDDLVPCQRPGEGTVWMGFRSSLSV